MPLRRHQAAGEAGLQHPASLRARLTYDPHATPKARLLGPAAAIELAVALLGPSLGPPHRLADGLGWNLNRRAFLAADRLLAAATIDPSRIPGSTKHRVLVTDGEIAVPRLDVGGRALLFVGYGKDFRLGLEQSRGGHRGAGLKPRTPVRFAYYA